MADGWLFRLSATLGARQSAPSWPTAPATPNSAAEPATPALRTVAPARSEAVAPTPNDRSSG